jgi:DnaJ-class molecular chaperone
MSKQRDYYDVLGVGRGSSVEAIRKAYRKLARQLHPDVNKAPDASKKFAEVQEAYDVLSDEQKRRAYDQFGHVGVGATGNGPAASWGAGRGTRGGRTVWTHAGPGTGDFNAGDFASIFEQMFGGEASVGMGGARTTGFGGRGGPQARPAPQRGQNIEHAITVSFMTAAMGGSEQIRMTAADGESNNITVKIPPGIDSGAKLRVRGKGQPGIGGEAGDLIITVQVGSHPFFRRDGLDLFIDVPVSIAEAVLGAQVTVPLITDGSVDVRIPPGTSSGQKLRVRGKGLADGKGATGDYYVVVQIIAPKPETLAPGDRAAIEELAKHLPNPRESAPFVDD